MRNKTEFYKYLRREAACPDALNWLTAYWQEHTFQQCWEDCPNYNWSIWLLRTLYTSDSDCYHPRILAYHKSVDRLHEQEVQSTRNLYAEKNPYPIDSDEFLIEFTRRVNVRKVILAWTNVTIRVMWKITLQNLWPEVKAALRELK
jgi:hypothetical protein